MNTFRRGVGGNRKQDNWLRRSHDRPIDMADAALVCEAEREGTRRGHTLNGADFAAYRLARKGGFTLLP